MGNSALSNKLEMRTKSCDNKALGRKIDYIFFKHYVILPWYEFDVSQGAQGIFEQAWAMIDCMNRSLDARKETAKKSGDRRLEHFQKAVIEQYNAAGRAVRLTCGSIKKLSGLSMEQLHEKIKALNLLKTDGDLSGHEKFQLKILDIMVEGDLKNIDFSEKVFSENLLIKSAVNPGLIEQKLIKFDESVRKSIAFCSGVYGMSHKKAANILSDFQRAKREAKKEAVQER